MMSRLILLAGVLALPAAILGQEPKFDAAKISKEDVARAPPLPSEPE